MLFYIIVIQFMDDLNKNQTENNKKTIKPITELTQKITNNLISNVIEKKFNEYKQKTTNILESLKKPPISRQYFKICYLCKKKIKNNQSSTFHAYDNIVCESCFYKIIN